MGGVEQIKDEVSKALEAYVKSPVMTIEDCRLQTPHTYLLSHTNVKCRVRLTWGEASRHALLTIRLYEIPARCSSQDLDSLCIDAFHVISQPIDPRSPSDGVVSLFNRVEKMLARLDEQAEYMGRLGYRRTGICSFVRRVYEGQSDRGYIRLYERVHYRQGVVSTVLNATDGRSKETAIEESRMEFKATGIIFPAIQAEHRLMSRGTLRGVDLRMEIFGSANELLREQLINQQPVDGLGRALWEYRRS